MLEGKRRYLYLAIAVVLLVFLIIIVFPILKLDKAKLPRKQEDIPKPLFTINNVKSPLNHPLAVAVSKDGKIYVTDSGSNKVQVFKTNGKYLFSFGQPGKAQGQFDTPYGIALLPDGSVLVSDMLNNRIQKFSRNGEFQKVFLPQGKGIKPGILLVDNNEVYVSDLASNQVVVLNLNGEIIRKYFGSMKYPQGLAKINDNLYVADAGNNQIRVYKNEGGQIKESTVRAKGNFQLLRGLTVDNLDRILVVDSIGSQVKFISADGKILGSFGSSGHAGNQFQYPAGIAVDSYGKIYIADWGNNRIQVWGY